jgi:hypothetical protein
MWQQADVLFPLTLAVHAGTPAAVPSIRSYSRFEAFLTLYSPEVIVCAIYFNIQ